MMMEPMKPPTPTNPLWKEHTYGEGQEKDGYQPLPGVVRPGNKFAPFICTFKFGEEEIAWLKERIAKGEDIFISLEMYTFGGKINPVRLVAGHFGEPYLTEATPPPPPETGGVM